jgi:hypothetical protein
MIENEAIAKQKITDFSDLLDCIDGASDKKKKLWLEIYQNAVTDRQNAYVLFTVLVEIADNKSTEHAVHGRTIATYIERMSKANDQLIKLAELIAKAEPKAEDLDPDEMFRRIGEK